MKDDFPPITTRSPDAQPPRENADTPAQAVPGREETHRAVDNIAPGVLDVPVSPDITDSTTLLAPPAEEGSPDAKPAVTIEDGQEEPSAVPGEDKSKTLKDLWKDESGALSVKDVGKGVLKWTGLASLGRGLGKIPWRDIGNGTVQYSGLGWLGRETQSLNRRWRERSCKPGVVKTVQDGINTVGAGAATAYPAWVAGSATAFQNMWFSSSMLGMAGTAAVAPPVAIGAGLPLAKRLIAMRHQKNVDANVHAALETWFPGMSDDDIDAIIQRSKAELGTLAKREDRSDRSPNPDDLLLQNAEDVALFKSLDLTDSIRADRVPYLATEERYAEHCLGVLLRLCHRTRNVAVDAIRDAIELRNIADWAATDAAAIARPFGNATLDAAVRSADRAVNAISDAITAAEAVATKDHDETVARATNDPIQVTAAITAVKDAARIAATAADAVATASRAAFAFATAAEGIDFNTATAVREAASAAERVAEIIRTAVPRTIPHGLTSKSPEFEKLRTCADGLSAGDAPTFECLQRVSAAYGRCLAMRERKIRETSNVWSALGTGGALSAATGNILPIAAAGGVVAVRAMRNRQQAERGQWEITPEGKLQPRGGGAEIVVGANAVRGSALYNPSLVITKDQLSPTGQAILKCMETLPLPPQWEQARSKEQLAYVLGPSVVSNFPRSRNLPMAVDAAAVKAAKDRLEAAQAELVFQKEQLVNVRAQYAGARGDPGLHASITTQVDGVNDEIKKLQSPLPAFPDSIPNLTKEVTKVEKGTPIKNPETHPEAAEAFSVFLAEKWAKAEEAQKTKSTARWTTAKGFGAKAKDFGPVKSVAGALTAFSIDTAKWGAAAWGIGQLVSTSWPVLSKLAPSPMTALYLGLAGAGMSLVNHYKGKLLGK